MATSSRTPAPLAARNQLRNQLGASIAAHIEKSGLTQAAAAQSLGITQPRLNALLRGHTEQFSLDALVQLAVRAGLNVQVTATRAYRQR